MYNGTAFSVGYVLSGLALVLISTVMLRSPRFSRLTGAAGLAAGVTGLVPANMGTLGFALSFVSLIPLVVWLFLVGRRFLQLEPQPQVQEPIRDDYAPFTGGNAVANGTSGH